MDLAIEHSPGLVLLALGGDDLEAALLETAETVADHVLLDAVGTVESAISNLDLSLDECDRLFRMVELLRAVASLPARA